MLPLTEMFTQFTDAVLELLPVTIVTLSCLPPTSPYVLSTTTQDLALNQVDDPGAATVQVVPDVVSPATIFAGK